MEDVHKLFAGRKPLIAMVHLLPTRNAVDPRRAESFMKAGRP